MADDEEDLYDDEFDFVDDDDDDEDSEVEEVDEVDEEVRKPEVAKRELPAPIATRFGISTATSIANPRSSPKSRHSKTTARPRPRPTTSSTSTSTKNSSAPSTGPSPPEDAEAFASEYNRTAKPYGRFALAGKDDAKPKKALD